EHEPALAVDVTRLAGDPAGDPPDQRLGRGEEPERGAAEVEPVSEGLALADRDVDPALARRLEQREGERIAGADRQRPDLARLRRQRIEPLDRAQEVRLLHHDRADALVELG